MNDKNPLAAKICAASVCSILFSGFVLFAQSANRPPNDRSGGPFGAQRDEGRGSGAQRDEGRGPGAQRDEGRGPGAQRDESRGPGAQRDDGRGFGSPPMGMPFPMGGPPGGQERAIVDQFDKDGDDRLNKEERAAAREFLKKDAANRPRMGPHGFNPAGFMIQPILQAADADRNKQLTAEEIRAGVQNLLAQSDVDASGSLTSTEISDMLNRAMPRPQGNMPFGPPGGDRRPMNHGPGNMIADALANRLDANKDGSASEAEIIASLDKSFSAEDKDENGSLSEQELTAAIAAMIPPPGGPGGHAREPAKPGIKVSPADVPAQGEAPLYDLSVLRTLFLEFETPDWAAEMGDFYRTDVEVPAKLTVDGRTYADVGVHYRGNSSYNSVDAEHKRSLNLSLDFVHPEQRLLGYRTLNLLNCNDDPSFLHTVLYSIIARNYIAAPKANFVRVIINGENWGVYVNAQQFNKDLIQENFQTTKGARWKSRAGGGGLEYSGDNVEDYKRRYEIKSKDDPKDWQALVELCRTLEKTPAKQLEKAIEPILDVEGALWFLALDVALVNNDGYWVRNSDYSLYRDPKGKFHILPHDMNESFSHAMMGGPGFGRLPGGPGPGGMSDRPNGGGGRQNGMKPPAGGQLDPLVNLDDERKPLRRRLLAVPAYKQRYLECVAAIANDGLDPEKLGPVIADCRALIAKEVEADTRKLYSFAAFESAVSDSLQPAAEEPGRRGTISLLRFAEERRRYLLSHPDIQRVQRTVSGRSPRKQREGKQP